MTFLFIRKIVQGIYKKSFQNLKKFQFTIENI